MSFSARNPLREGTPRIGNQDHPYGWLCHSRSTGSARYWPGAQSHSIGQGKRGQDRFPDDFVDLEKRYLQTRGTFYACQEAKASEMALALVNDAQSLAAKRVAVPPPPNQTPKASIVLPVGDADVESLVQFQYTGSVDPDGETLTYQWAFGDGGTASLANRTQSYSS